MTDLDPIILRPAGDGLLRPGVTAPLARPTVISFNRRELDEILSVYGRRVAEGEWRDYAIDMLRDRAVFSIFRRTAEAPLYRIEKNPRLARRQGIYSVIATTGLIMKRGQDLCRVLRIFDRGSLTLVKA
jgi:hypothetical protein